MKKKKLFLRILLSPFVLIIHIITFMFLAFKHTGLFLYYGGEWITYSNEYTPTIHKIYSELEREHKSNEKFRQQIKSFEKHYRNVPIQKEKNGVDNLHTVFDEATKNYRETLNNLKDDAPSKD